MPEPRNLKEHSSALLPRGIDAVVGKRYADAWDAFTAMSELWDAAYNLKHYTRHPERNVTYEHVNTAYKTMYAVYHTLDRELLDNFVKFREMQRREGQ